MTFAASISPGPLSGPTFSMPPQFARGMGRGRRSRMAAWAAMSEAIGDLPGDERSDDTEPIEDGRGRRGGSHHRGHGGRRGGPGPWGGRGPWGPRRGRRRERGEVRAAVLLLLAEQPRHGYELLTELADRSDGQWQPSPGSIYPVLKRLAQDGLVEATHTEGKRVFSLTPSGVALVEAEGATWGQPWAQSTNPEDEAVDQLWTEGRQLGAAVRQVSELQDPEQIAAAIAVLVEARKRIYGLLAQ